jgi:KAP family P-loop domain
MRNELPIALCNCQYRAYVDRLCVQPAFGYAPFARRLSRAISETPSPEGLVMAIHGPWGCGKSTLLNFVKYEIAALPEEYRPVVIDFNPWWFEGQQNLAAQFLAQFSARLPRESQALREIGNVLAEYADAVGSVVAASTGIPLVGKLSFVLKLLKRKSKDVPALKAEISKLCESRRFQSSWETPGKQSQTPLSLTTTLPLARPASTYAKASLVDSNGNTRSITGRIAPASMRRVISSS